MPIPPNELPEFTVIQTLPSIVVSSTPITSPAISVPVGTKEIRATLNGSAWPAGTTVAAQIEISLNAGEDWSKGPNYTATNESLMADGTCFAGIPFGSLGNQNANYRLRAVVAAIHGGSITLSGTVSTT